MKKHWITRFISVILSVIMVLVAIPFSVFTTVATDTVTEEENSITKIEKYRLDAINGVTNRELFNYVEGSFNTESIDASLHKSVVQKNLEGATKTFKIVSAGFKLINSFTGGANPILTGISDGFGAAGDITGEFVEDDSSKQLMSAIGDLSDQLEGVSKQISELSEVNRKYITGIANYLTDYIELASYKDKLLEFSSNTEGNYRFGDYKDYYTWQDNLFIRLNALLAAEKNVQEGKIAEEQLSYYYDQLYLVAKESDELYSYLTSNGLLENASIQEVLYRYYLLSPNNNNMEKYVEECINYSSDWYSTYLISQSCLNMCYIYQLNSLIDQFGAENLDASSDYKGGNDIVVNFKGEIERFLLNPNKNTDEVTREMTKYYARILCLDESYIYEPIDYLLWEIQYREVSDKFNSSSYNALLFDITDSVNDTVYIRTNNEVSYNSTIYMNVMPDIFANYFKNSLFTFEINEESKELATVNNAGVVFINDKPGTFTVTMRYDGDEVYSIDFIIKDNPFSGGMGTEQMPYLISNWKDIQTLASDSTYYNNGDIHYKLVNNINAEGAVFSGIPSFKGLFDGDGYSIYNFKMTVLEYYVGFFKQIQSGAVIKNLILGHDEYEQSVACSRTSYNKTYFGGLAGYNAGTIQNCEVINLTIGANITYEPSTVLSFAGGLVGENCGIIENSKVTGCNVNAYAVGQNGSHNNSYAYAGGAVGASYSGSIISNCYIKNTSIMSYAEANGGSVENADAYSQAGGLVGEAVSGTYTNNLVKGINVNPTGVQYDDGALYSSSNSVGYTVDNSLDIVYTPGGSASGAQPEEIYIKNYIRGELRYKFIDESGQIAELPLSEYRIDTSDIGAGQVIHLEPINNTSNYRKTVIDINVAEEEVLGIYVYTQPNKTQYIINDTAFDCSGLNVVALYNNGRIKFLNNGSPDISARDYSVKINASDIGSSTISLCYKNYTTSIDINVICDHNSTTIVDARNATCTSVGYTEGVYCNVCREFISGHEEIPILSTHAFGSWIKYNDTVHNRFCECGEIEYADHKWDNVTITVEPTQTTEGVKTYTCDECGATKTATIPIVQPEHIPGDINGDGVVNTKDTTRLMRYLAGWDVEVNEAALDVNGDGVINTKDTTRLMRYLAGWDVDIY